MTARTKRTAAWVVGVIIVICLTLQLTQTKLLIWQSRTEAGTGGGEVTNGLTRLNSTTDGFKCHYFTGRSVVDRHFGDARDGIYGVDECPLLLGAED